MTRYLRNRLLILLAALLMASGLVLPAMAASGPPCHHHHAVAAHHHEHGQQSAHHHQQAADWRCDEQGVSCDACAICCCGAVLPSSAMLDPGRPAAIAPVAIAPPLGKGVVTDRDPYPPKRWRV